GGVRQRPPGRVERLDRARQEANPAHRHAVAVELDTIAGHGADALEDGLSAAGATTRAEVASRASEGSDSRGQTGRHERSPGRGVGDHPIDPARRASGDVEANAQAEPGRGAGDADETD